MAEFDLKISSRNDEPRGRQLALLAADVAALAQLVDVDGADDLARLGEPRQHVLEVVALLEAEGVLELEHEVGLGGAGRADEQQRLLGDGRDAHQVDDFLLVDEEAAERFAKAIDALAYRFRLGLEIHEERSSGFAVAATAVAVLAIIGSGSSEFGSTGEL